jgi:hypothetical protein
VKRHNRTVFADKTLHGAKMEQIDIICSIMVIASFTFVFGLMVGGPLYAAYRSWKEKREFRLRDQRDARLREEVRMGKKR